MKLNVLITQGISLSGVRNLTARLWTILFVFEQLKKCCSP